MTPVEAASHSSLIQESLGSEVSRDPGKMENSSSHVLSTQTSSKDSTEELSFITRFLGVVIEIITRVCHCLKLLFKYRITPERALALNIIAIKNIHLTTSDRLLAFDELLLASKQLLERCSEQDTVAIYTQIQIGYNELPSGLKKELYQRLSLSRTEQLIIDSDEGLQAALEAVYTIYNDLPSVALGELQTRFYKQFSNKEQVRILLKIIRLSILDLDPDVTAESLKRVVLDLFGTFNEPLKSEIDVEMRKIAYKQSRSTDDVEGGGSVGFIHIPTINIEGVSISFQDPSLGRRIVYADPLGPIVQSGLTEWLDK